MRQIVVAFERQSNCDRLREALESTGEFSCLTCRSAAQVKRTVAKLRLDLVVCGFKLTDESCETLYTSLQLSGKLNSYLADIDQQAQERLDTIIRQMAEAQGITEALKAADPMAWVGQMNNIQVCAREIVNAELIYA